MLIKCSQVKLSRKMFVTVIVGVGLFLSSIFSIYFILTDEYINYAEYLIFTIILIYLAKIIIKLINNNININSSIKRKNIFLIMISVLLCFISLELYLRYVYRETSAPHHFISQKDREVNEQIKQANQVLAQKHPHGFNDEVRRVQKEPGIYRLAVLGDSFVWGDGVTYDQIWSHKLERRLLAGYRGQVEVLSWGLRGWSTLDEYNFLKQYGVHYNINTLIIGFVQNDPDMGYYKQRYFKLNQMSVIKPFKFFLPNAINFFGDQVESLINRYADIGYINWEEKLYTQDNLDKYFQLLKELSTLCQSHSIALLVVHTPANYDPYYREKFDKIIPLLKQANIAYLDLHPVMARDLGGYTYRQLMANPANPHPGPLVTEVYAREVFDYLRKNHLKHLKTTELY